MVNDDAAWPFKTAGDPGRGRALRGTVVAAVLGAAAGSGSSALIPALFPLAGGFPLIAVATAALALAASIVHWTRPGSGLPVLVLALAAVIAGGPLGLYVLPLPLLVVIPVALAFALAQKKAIRAQLRSDP